MCIFETISLYEAGHSTCHGWPERGPREDPGARLVSFCRRDAVPLDAVDGARKVELPGLPLSGEQHCRAVPPALVCLC